MSGLGRVGEVASSVWQHPVGKGLAIGTGVAVPVGLVGLGVGNHLINEADSRVKRDLLMGAGTALGIGAGGALATHLVRGSGKQAAPEGSVYTLRPPALRAATGKTAALNLTLDADDPYDLGAYAKAHDQSFLTRAMTGAVSPWRGFAGGVLGLGLGAGFEALRGGLHVGYGLRLRDVARAALRDGGDLSSLNMAERWSGSASHRAHDSLPDVARGVWSAIRNNSEDRYPILQHVALGGAAGLGGGAVLAGAVLPGINAASQYAMGYTYGAPDASLPGADTLRAGARGVRRAVNWVGDSVADRFAPHPWYVQAGQRAAALPGQALDTARSALGSIPNPFAPKPWTTRLYEGASEGIGDVRERLFG